MFSFKETRAQILTEAGKQKIQGLAFLIQDALKTRWQQFRSKRKQKRKGMCVEHGELAYEALLRSDVDGNFEIDADELKSWLKSYPEMKALFNLKGPRGFFKKYACKEDVGLRRKELLTMKRDIATYMDLVDFYRKEEPSMMVLQEQFTQGLVPSMYLED